ncbi:substrate-binding domain-containing protein [Pseudonocardia kujensis]|uniref:substrate-binding domain-containing protein n=1 Tax=Pseudonocardia kujensis TaxID=1128675 RepID=UPI003557F436
MRGQDSTQTRYRSSPGDYRLAAGEKCGDSAESDPRPTVRLCANGLMAIGGRGVLQTSRSAVLQDVSILWFDDLPVSALLTPRLTTVRQPAHEMGFRAASALFDLLENDESSRGGGQLARRGACSAVLGTPRMRRRRCRECCFPSDPLCVESGAGHVRARGALRARPRAPSTPPSSANCTRCREKYGTVRFRTWRLQTAAGSPSRGTVLLGRTANPGGRAPESAVRPPDPADDSIAQAARVALWGCSSAS